MDSLTTLIFLTLVLAIFFIAMHKAGQSLKWAAETRRKSIHVLLGIICLTFPWLFDETWPVVVLCIITLISLISLRLIPKARDSLGSSLHSVNRLSLGEIFFPIAVAWSFAASEGETILYITSIAILTLADAGGALVGVRFGKNRFSTLGSLKSIEGSFCFFTLAYLCIFLPLFISNDTPITNALLIGFVLAMLATIVEGVSSHGFDNILLPVISLLLLKLFLDLDLEQLIIKSVIISISLAIIVALRKFSTLDGGGLLGSAFYAYTCYAMGNLWFLCVGLLFYGLYLILNKWTELVPKSSHSIDSVITVATTGLFWLTLHYTQTIETPTALLCFTLGLGAHLTMMCCNSCLLLGHHKSSLVSIFLPIPLFITISFAGYSMINILLLIAYLPLLLLSSKLFTTWYEKNDSSSALVLKQSLLALGISSIGLIQL